MIPFTILGLKIGESWFQSQYQGLIFKGLDFCIDFKTLVFNFVLSSKVSEEHSYTESDYKEEIWSDSNEDLENDDIWNIFIHFFAIVN